MLIKSHLSRRPTWPDYIKGADGYTNDGEHPTNANAADNIGYDDKLQHRHWHFFDTPFAADNTATHGPDAVSGLTQVRMFVRALQKSDDDSVKSYDLVWIEHIVGDLHQPLHATSRFDVDARPGTMARTGSISAPRSKPRDHPLSARLLCTPSGTEYRERARARPPLGAERPNFLQLIQRKQAIWSQPTGSTKASSWPSRTCIEPVELGDGPFVLTADYRANARKIAS